MSKRAFDRLKIAKLLEVEGVVPHLSGIVEDGAVAVLDNVGEVEIFEFGAFDEAVEIVDIGKMVLVVVIAESFFANRRTESLVVVG